MNSKLTNSRCPASVHTQTVWFESLVHIGPDSPHPNRNRRLIRGELDSIDGAKVDRDSGLNIRGAGPARVAT